MSVIPFIIPQGTVLVYGVGIEQSIYGVVPTNTIFKFATIYDIASDVTEYSLGQNVMFKSDAVLATLKYNEVPYTIIEEARLAGVDYSEPM